MCRMTRQDPSAPFAISFGATSIRLPRATPRGRAGLPLVLQVGPPSRIAHNRRERCVTIHDSNLVASQLLPLLVEDGLHGLLRRLQGRLDGTGAQQDLLDALAERVADVAPSQHVWLGPGVREALGDQTDVRWPAEAVV